MAGEKGKFTDMSEICGRSRESKKLGTWHLNWIRNGKHKVQLCQWLLLIPPIIIDSSIELFNCHYLVWSCVAFVRICYHVFSRSHSRLYYVVSLYFPSVSYLLFYSYFRIQFVRRNKTGNKNKTNFNVMRITFSNVIKIGK